MFIISICLCTTSPELARIEVAGCVSLRTALGSSAMWTGARRLFSEGVVEARASDMEGVDEGAPWAWAGDGSGLLIRGIPVWVDAGPIWSWAEDGSD